MRSVYDYSDYKRFILDSIEELPSGSRGARTKLAEAISCQGAYVSHVLGGNKDFSLEQAEAAARFLELREDHAEFLIILVQHARAGTVELRRHFKKQLDQKKLEFQQLKNRVQISRTISEIDQATYYSDWSYQAVHSILSIPAFRTPKNIADHLGLSISKVNNAIKFLMQVDLVNELGELGVHYQAKDKSFHLPRSSPLISKLHSNWRVKTLSMLDAQDDLAHHYSGLLTIAVSDAEKVREILRKALEEIATVVKPSSEEEIYLLAMDFKNLKAT